MDDITKKVPIFWISVSRATFAAVYKPIFLYRLASKAILLETCHDGVDTSGFSVLIISHRINPDPINNVAMGKRFHKGPGQGDQWCHLSTEIIRKICAILFEI